MARFHKTTYNQPSATKTATQDAARDYLKQQIMSGSSKDAALLFGVTQKTVTRWRAFLTGSSSQKRDPFKQSTPKIAKATARAIRINVTADYTPADDDEYLKEDYGLYADFADPASMLESMVNAPNEAWENFFEANYYPSGTLDNISSFSITTR